MRNAFVTKKPGGTGTLVELAIVWELFNKNLLSVKPFACVG
ncbi:MAG: hypothetical protein V1720_02505 [bacterium]